MKSFDQRLVEAVRDKREALGLSIRALSAVVGISFSTLARIERGDGLPDNNSKIRLLEWLGDDADKAGLSFDQIAFVHFRAGKNIRSTTVQALLNAADCLKEDWSKRNRPSGLTKEQSEHVPLELSKEELERAAERFRRDLGLAADQPLDSLKLTVEGVEIVKLTRTNCLDSATVRKLSAEACEEWSAMSVPLSEIDDEWAVLLNDCHSVERQRVTLLEELWHILLGHKLTKIARIAESYGRTYDSAEEHSAYYLASATLLPREAVIEGVAEGQSSAEIALRFGTSPELVDYRVKRLGLWRDHTGKKVVLAG